MASDSKIYICGIKSAKIEAAYVGSFHLLPTYPESVSAHIEGSQTRCRYRIGLGSNPGEDLDVCKCIVSLRHGGTLNSRRATCPLVRLVEGEERWEDTDHPQGVLPQNWSGTEPNRTVPCMLLKATANDNRTTSPLPR
ncbi:uncharacterized protein TNCV_3684691 [Trichonephila clavipes]|uniref:Uncharacterized protein n=1 Tax=Trichonephila clavipes TaxID=2585209 RepID=A0A8X6V572_TRICX|nr:uncharacterized protein TNCV_3684691 [Trichonephila clavipes]